VPQPRRHRCPTCTATTSAVVDCWWLKHVTTFDPQAYSSTPFSPQGDSQGSCQSAEQGDC
jgi:hypothetical protein